MYIQEGHVESLYIVFTTLVVVIPLERVESLLEVIRVHPGRDHLLAALLFVLFDLGPIQSRGDVGQLQVKGYAQLVWRGGRGDTWESNGREVEGWLSQLLMLGVCGDA